MGAVKGDIHKHEHPYKQISFSDVDCIKGLIKNRWMIDSYRGLEQNYNIYEAGDVKSLNQELICLFVDLDNLIQKAKLNAKQIAIVEMLMDGFTEEDVAEYFKQDAWGIGKILDTVCRKIKKVNDYDWKYNNLYLNFLKGNWEYKICNKCSESKPKTNEFYRERIDQKGDGFYNSCRDCEK